MVTTFLPRGAELVLPTVLGQLPELVGGGDKKGTERGVLLLVLLGATSLLGSERPVGQSYLDSHRMRCSRNTC